MRTFTVIWLGQIVSTMGSYMTEFALTLWAWELTGQATPLALVGFSAQLPKLVVNLFAGIIVDRISRKFLMILGDTVAGLATGAIALLLLTHRLQLWHLYTMSAVTGSFAQIQQLAYSTSISLIVPERLYTRANSMGSMVHYGSAIVAPGLAGVLYPQIGLLGLLLMDGITFVVAVATLLSIHIPKVQSNGERTSESIGHQLGFGFRFIWRHPGLRALLITTALFWFAHDLGGAIYDPMILARTDGNATILGSTAAAAGIGGVVGALIVSAWGGAKRQIDGMLLGFIGAGVSKTIFGLGRSPLVWLPAQFCSSLNFPLLGSSETAIWMMNVPSALQGRVFAANALVIQAVSAIAFLNAGFLADTLLEPLMKSNKYFSLVFSPLVGQESGSGIALLYIFCSIAMLLVGVSAYRSEVLKEGLRQKR